jgi:hypothetical protein
MVQSFHKVQRAVGGRASPSSAQAFTLRFLASVHLIQHLWRNYVLQELRVRFDVLRT